MKTILVTGIGGFLGSHCAEHLLRAGHRVIGLDDLSGGTISNIPPGVIFYKGDICDEAAVNRLFAHHKIDAIVHCAAFASENLSHNCRLHTYRSIVMGSATLVNAAVNHGVELFVNMSSIAVYGPWNPPFSEQDTPMRSRDPYGSAKGCVEHDMIAAEEMFGLKTVTFRPHNIIGTRQSLADSTRNVASIFIRQALTGKPLTIFGSGTQTRAWSPVSHVAKIIAACVDRPDTWSNTYNIGGEQVITVFDLANIVCELAEVPPDFQFLPERNEAKHAHSRHERVQKAFPDMAHGEESIPHCIADMIVEARSRPLPPVQALPRIEINSKLNPAWTHQT